ncbi:hypothetical protein I3760_07G013100 [Carya illinoinensis]|nr:hypothetical protein I3760_07G013100 [Carya illinoinensis]
MAEPSVSQPHDPQPVQPPSRGTNHPVNNTLASVANLANLLPTGTVLTFQVLTPTFSNNGSCNLFNKCLTASIIVFCAICCLLSSFTDSFADKDGKVYHGIATTKGLYIFNADNYSSCEDTKNLDKFKLSFIDFVHAFVSLFVFMIFAVSDSSVQSCFFPGAGANEKALIMNLPLIAGVLSSFVFTIFPTRRKGIGFSH